LNIMYTMFLPKDKKAVLGYTIAWMAAMMILSISVSCLERWCLQDGPLSLVCGYLCGNLSLGVSDIPVFKQKETYGKTSVSV